MAWLFQPLLPGAAAQSGGGTTGQIKYRTGAAWTAKPVKYWNGATWTLKPVKYWNGATWVTTTY